jgi:hypothetical protein
LEKGISDRKASIQDLVLNTRPPRILVGEVFAGGVPKQLCTCVRKVTAEFAVVTILFLSFFRLRPMMMTSGELPASSGSTRFEGDKDK